MASIGAAAFDGCTLFDQFFEAGAVGKAGQAVGDKFAAQVALGHHFLRPVDQRQQEQPVVVARFGGQGADRSAQVARGGPLAQLAGKLLRFVGVLRCPLDRAQQFNRRVRRQRGQLQPVEGRVAGDAGENCRGRAGG